MKKIYLVFAIISLMSIFSLNAAAQKNRRVGNPPPKSLGNGLTGSDGGVSEITRRANITIGKQSNSSDFRRKRSVLQLQESIQNENKKFVDMPDDNEGQAAIIQPGIRKVRRKFKP